jgi:hypothetical protein
MQKRRYNKGFHVEWFGAGQTRSNTKLSEDIKAKISLNSYEHEDNQNKYSSFYKRMKSNELVQLGAEKLIHNVDQNVITESSLAEIGRKYINTVPIPDSTSLTLNSVEEGCSSIDSLIGEPQDKKKIGLAIILILSAIASF